MRDSFYIVRHGEIEQVWRFRIVVNGFNTYLFVRGTETEAREYVNSEYPHEAGSHVAMSEKELEAIGELGITIYIAPRK